VTYVTPEMRAAGWSVNEEGLGVRTLLSGGGWALRELDSGVGLVPSELRGLSLLMGAVELRVGVMPDRRLRRWVRFVGGWPVGSGWIKAILGVDVFAVGVRFWHDEGEASYLS
jgi:hypothetical protein